MGLDTTHDAWHGPYSSFNNWRNMLAVIAGYTLTDERFQTPVVDWDTITEQNIEGEWESIPSDPLLVLIAHSDCDGVIHPREGEALERRLAELASHIPPEYDDGRTQQFIDGLHRAHIRGEDIEFH